MRGSGLAVGQRVGEVETLASRAFVAHAEFRKIRFRKARSEASTSL